MRIALITFFLFVLFSCNNARNETTTSRHSAGFNASVQSAMDNYHTLVEAFVNWDSATVMSEATHLNDKLGQLNLSEFKSDVSETATNSMNQAKRDLQFMALNNTITEKRHALNSLSQNIYDFLRAVQYDEKKIFLHDCPMAFGEEQHGQWLSETDTIRNPYLGLHHPDYGKSMISCGDTKSTIDFTSGRPASKDAKSNDQNTKSGK
jgi:hypothetical protein